MVTIVYKGAKKPLYNNCILYSYNKYKKKRLVTLQRLILILNYINNNPSINIVMRCLCNKKSFVARMSCLRLRLSIGRCAFALELNNPSLALGLNLYFIFDILLCY